MSYYSKLLVAQSLAHQAINQELWSHLVKQENTKAYVPPTEGKIFQYAYPMPCKLVVSGMSEGEKTLLLENKPQILEGLREAQGKLREEAKTLYAEGETTDNEGKNVYILSDASKERLKDISLESADISLQIRSINRIGKGSLPAFYPQTAKERVEFDRKRAYKLAKAKKIAENKAIRKANMSKRVSGKDYREDSRSKTKTQGINNPKVKSVKALNSKITHMSIVIAKANAEREAKLAEVKDVSAKASWVLINRDNKVLAKGITVKPLLNKAKLGHMLPSVNTNRYYQFVKALQDNAQRGIYLTSKLVLIACEPDTKACWPTAGISLTEAMADSK
jgi:hypothetical protein